MKDGLDFSDLTRRMHGAVSVLKTELSGLRTGRASAHLLDPVTVSAYGTQMPINQVATVNVPEPRMLSVQVWDKALAGAVDRAIRDANLGLNPIMEGTLLRIPIPELNAERRQEMVKVGAQICRAGASRGPPRPPRRHGHAEEAREGRPSQPGRHPHGIGKAAEADRRDDQGNR